MTSSNTGTTGLVLPTWNEHTEGFWQAAHDHRLVVNACADCGLPAFPPMPVCRHCQSDHRVWLPTTGRGRIYTWTTVYHSTRQEFRDDVPYLLAVAELEDYPVRIPARLVGASGLTVEIGAPVHAAFADLTAEVSLLRWALDSEAEVG